MVAHGGRELPPGLRDLRRIQRSRPVLDTDIIEFLEGHFRRPPSPEQVDVIRSFLRHDRLVAFIAASMSTVRIVREVLRDDEGSVTIPRWGGWRDFTSIPEIVGDPPAELSKVELTRGGLDLLEAVPRRALRRVSRVDEIAIYLHLGAPGNPAEPNNLDVVMGDSPIGTVDVSSEPGLSQLAADAVRNGQMLAFEGRVLLSAPPRAFIELYYR